MIAFLKGLLEAKQDTGCTVDVNGVGYEVLMPASDLERLPSQGEPVVIHTWYVVREDSAQLFGFLQSEDRALFKILLSISGIGPKSALAVLSGLTQSEQDVDRLQRLPGIGRKTAERLLLELKDKIKISVLLPRQAGAGGGREDYGEAMEALSSLGYTQFQARTALQKVLDQDLPAREPGKDRVAELVKRALKHL
jgi:Holliday junction DNA helicase RuvA